MTIFGFLLEHAPAALAALAKDVQNQWLAAVLAVASVSFRFLRYILRLRRDPPARIVCAKQDMDSELDHALGEMHRDEGPQKVYYAAFHNGRGNWISAIGARFKAKWSRDQEKEGRLDYLPRSSWDDVLRRLIETGEEGGVRAAEFSPGEITGEWNRIFDTEEFERVAVVECIIPRLRLANGRYRDHHGFAIFCYSETKARESVFTDYPGAEHEKPALNLTVDTLAQIRIAGHRCEELLHKHHYNRPATQKLREAFEDFATGRHHDD